MPSDFDFLSGRPLQLPLFWSFSPKYTGLSCGCSSLLYGDETARISLFLIISFSASLRPFQTAQLNSPSFEGTRSSHNRLFGCSPPAEAMIVAFNSISLLSNCRHCHHSSEWNVVLRYFFLVVPVTLDLTSAVSHRNFSCLLTLCNFPQDRPILTDMADFTCPLLSFSRQRPVHPFIPLSGVDAILPCRT